MISPDPVLGLAATDRTIQDNAVRAIASSEADYTNQLIELWRQSDRRDVHRHIIRAFVGMGDLGAPGLLNLCQQRLARKRTPIYRHVIFAFWEIGGTAIGLLEDAVRTGALSSDETLWQLSNVSPYDPAPFALRMAHSTDIREAARIRLRLQSTLPITTRSTWAIRLAHAICDGEFASDACPPMPYWSKADRMSDPGAYSRFAEDVLALLPREHPGVLASACHAIAVNRISDQYSHGRIRDLFSRGADAADRTSGPGPDSPLHEAAMRAYVAVHPNVSLAVRDVVSHSDTSPMSACMAVATVPAEYFDDHSIRQLVRISKDANDEVDLWGDRLFFSGHWQQASPTPLGDRAVPVMEMMVRAPDEPGADTASSLLGLIADSKDDLTYRRRRFEEATDTQEKFGRALQVLNKLPHDKGASAYVRQALLCDEKSADLQPYAFRHFVETHLEEQWVSQLLDEILSDPSHSFFDTALYTSPHGIVKIEGLQPELVKDLLATDDRDSYRAYALGDTETRFDTALHGEEQVNRQRARMLLKLIGHPRMELLDALVSLLRDPFLDRSLPDRAGYAHATDPAEHRLRALGFAMAHAFREGAENADVLAILLDRAPSSIPDTLERMVDSPVGLAIVLTRRFQKDGQWVSLELPGETADRVVTASIWGLMHLVGMRPSSQPERHLLHDSLSRHACQALAKLSRHDSDIERLILHQIRFGSGDMPDAALAALGSMRPWKRKYVELLRDHLNGSLSPVHVAAEAAMAAGPHAEPLVDELIAIGLEDLSSNSWYSVQRALNAIAPEDSRVLEFNAKVDAWSAEQRQRREALHP